MSDGARLDLSRWAVVAHKDDTGFGRQAQDIRSVLGIGRHLVIPSERLWDKPITGLDEVLLEPNCSADQLKTLLSGLQGIIFYERHNWHPLLLSTAKELGVCTVCLPMWEWFNGSQSDWRNCDLFICCSKYSLSIVASYGFSNAVLLPVAVDLSRFPARKIGGPARQFVHNAGLVDMQDRKATRETILAFKKVKRQDIRLLVRMQKPAELPALDERITVEVGNLKSPADLYAGGDAAVQPSKMEGIGFMVLEPILCGLPVITLDYPPMNEFVQQPEMLARKRWFKRKAFSTSWIKHAHLRLPDVDDLARKIEWCCENDLSEIAAENRSWSETNFDPLKLKAAYESTLGQLLARIKAASQNRQ